MPWLSVKFSPPCQFRLVIASVSLLVLQVTEKLVVVTVLVVGLIVCDMAARPNTVRRARTARNETEALRMRRFASRLHWRVMRDLLRCSNRGPWGSMYLY